MRCIFTGFLVAGDTLLKPLDVPKEWADQWKARRDSGIRMFLTAQPSIDVKAPIENPNLACIMSREHLSFVAFDPKSDSDDPAYACGFRMTEFPAHRLAIHLTCLVEMRDAVRETQRREFWDMTRRQSAEFSDAVLGKLKTGGMQFGSEGRADNGINAVTSLWLEFIALRRRPLITAQPS